MGMRQGLGSTTATVRPTRQQHVALLRAVAERAAQVTWTPELLRLLLDELDVGNDFGWLRAPGIPKHRYPQVVALALLSRHEARPDDFVNAARRLGLLATRKRRRVRPLSKGPTSRHARRG